MTSDLVLTTYALLRYDKDVLLARDYHLVILDEAQNIKNPKATTTQLVHQLKARHRLCLSGTPMENHLGELWSLCHFLNPGLLGDSQTFRRVSFGPRSRSTMMLIGADFWRDAFAPIFSVAPKPRSNRTCPRRPRSSRTSR